MRRLPDTSLTHALRTGGWEHFGWGQDRHLIADLYDGLSYNTRTTWAVAGGKPPEFPLWPRPKTKTNESDDPEAKRKKFSVKALWHRWNSRAATQGGE